MLGAGDKIKYRDVEGEVITAMQDSALVKLEDGKEYNLPYSELTKLDGARVLSPTNIANAINAMKPHMKNMEFLNDLAKVMQEHGISELHVRNGKIARFQSIESLEERTTRYKAEAIKKAEGEAKKDHEAESKE